MRLWPTGCTTTCDRRTPPLTSSSTTVGRPASRSCSESSSTVPSFDDPVRNVVGAKTAKGLVDLGIETAGDLLRHYPRRYAERGELTQLDELELGEHVTVLARVKRAHTRRMKNRPGTICEVI